MKKSERKAKFKASLQHVWPLYLLGIATPCVILPFAFNLYHQPKPNETISIFITGKTNNLSFQDQLKEEMKDYGIKMVESISCDIKDSIYFEKLTKVAFNRCDLFLIPSSIAEHINLDEVCVPINDELSTTYFDDKTPYVSDRYSDTYGYAYDMENGYLKDCVNFDSEDLYLFVNGASKNIGKYSERYECESLNAFIAGRIILN